MGEREEEVPVDAASCEAEADDAVRDVGAEEQDGDVDIEELAGELELGGEAGGGVAERGGLGVAVADVVEESAGVTGDE